MENIVEEGYVFIEYGKEDQYKISQTNEENTLLVSRNDNQEIISSNAFKFLDKYFDLVIRTITEDNHSFFEYTAKLDETRSFGNLISFAHKTKKSITYFSVGQNVPDDLIVSDSTFLIDCFMNHECIRR